MAIMSVTAAQVVITTAVSQAQSPPDDSAIGQQVCTLLAPHASQVVVNPDTGITTIWLQDGCITGQGTAWQATSTADLPF